MTWFDRAKEHLAKWQAGGTVPNFTPRAMQVLALARQEADRLRHDYLGTEHLLLGLIKLGQGVAVNALHKLGLNLETVRMEVEKSVGINPGEPAIGNIPYTPRTKKVIMQAQQDARTLNHKYVGTEHLLLGLLSEREGPTAKIFEHFKIDLLKLRNEILKELAPKIFPPETGQSGKD